MTNAQQLTVSATNVTADNSPAGSGTVKARILVGDVNENGSVSVSDVNRTKAQSGFAVTGIPPRSPRVSEIGDDRFALLCLFHTRINHLSSWHELLRVGQILVQLSLVPDNVRVLVGIGVVEPRDGSRLTADDTSQARAEAVLAGLDGMADPTGGAE